MCILAIVTFPNDSNPVDGKNTKYATYAEKVAAKRCANATGSTPSHTWQLILGYPVLRPPSAFREEKLVR
jgi:hypothetical protein